MLEHAIVKAVVRWVERGRNRDAIAEDGIFVLRYGFRFRVQCLVVFLLCGFFFSLGLFTLPEALREPGLDDWPLLLAGGLTLLASIHLVYVLTSRVEIDDSRVKVRCFGLTVSQCKARDVASAYQSPVHASVVLVDLAGRKTRISTQFDGLRALVAWLALRPDNVLRESIREWMRKEAPDGIEC